MKTINFNTIRFVNSVRFEQVRNTTSDSHHEMDVEPTTYDGKEALYVVTYRPAEDRVTSRELVVLDTNPEYKRITLVHSYGLKMALDRKNEKDVYVEETTYNGIPAVHVVREGRFPSDELFVLAL